MANPKYVDAFINLGKISDFLNIDYQDLIALDVFKILEEFVCLLYGFKNLVNLNEARYKIFCKTYKIKDLDSFLSINVKSFDASNLPPCKTEFAKHFLRASYITWIWQEAYNPITDYDNFMPTSFGWQIGEDKDGNAIYNFDWYYEQALPKLKDIVVEDVNNEGKPLLYGEILIFVWFDLNLLIKFLFGLQAQTQLQKQMTGNIYEMTKTIPMKMNMLSLSLDLKLTNAE